MDEPMDVSVHQETTPAGLWVVELRKMGARLPIRRFVKENREVAFAVAKDLAAFLGIPLRVPPTAQDVPDHQTQED